MTPAMVAALKADHVTLFAAVRVALPSATIRLIDGASTITISGETYSGSDPTYGTLGGIDTMSDGVGDEAPALQLNFLPPDTSGIAGLSAPSAQGSVVNLSLGAIASGAVVDAPEVLFAGELDSADVTVGKDTQSVDVTAVGGMERFFDNDEGVRLAGSWHKSVWPGETGLDQVTGVTRRVYWGMSAPNGSGSIVSSGGVSPSALVGWGITHLQ